MTKVSVRNAGQDGQAASSPANKTETPTQQVTKTATETAYEVDARGRRIGARRVTFLQTFRITKMLGAASGVPASLNLAMSACSVVEIDGEAVPFPHNEKELEFLMQKLDFEGIEAATKAIKQFAPESEAEEAEAAKN